MVYGKGILNILLDLVFIAVFNVLFFVLGGVEHIASVWISYVFIHLAYVMILITARLIRKGRCSAIFGFSLYSISSVYFFLEFIIGLLFVFKLNESYKVALSIQLILAGVYAILLLAHLIMNEHTADAIEKQTEEGLYIKRVSLNIKELMNRVEDKEAGKKLEKVYDLMHSSPVRSIPQVKEIESQIAESILEIEKAVDANDISLIIEKCKSLTILIEERNKILRVNN